jgi:tetratricopeptide (TPR) repeat protein
MVATVGLRLASEGYRVLVTDLDLEAPTLYRYLTAFLPAATADGQTTSPVRLTCQFADPQGSLDFLGPTSDSAADPAHYAITRAALAASGYDHVLIDAPASVRGTELIRELADTLVLGFTLIPQDMDKARDVAQALLSDEPDRDIQIVPVPMRVDQAGATATEKMRLRARQLFAWLPYRGEIEIPYEPDYAIEEELPLLDDYSEQRTQLVRAYVQLATLLAPGRSPAAEIRVTDETRAHYRAARRAGSGGETAVTVLAAAADRHWAEWLVSQLRGMGLIAARRRIDQPGPRFGQSASELLVVSAQLLSVPDLESHLAAVGWPSSDGDQLQFGVSIDGARLPKGQFATLGYASLHGKNEKEAREELASFYLAPTIEVTVTDPRDFPGEHELTSNLPPRNGACYGRDDELDEIRDHFTSGDRDDPFVLTGQPGIGKGALALEYAYRFASHYDLIFRLDADSIASIDAGLVELSQLAPFGPAAGDHGPAALRSLQSPARTAKRWLLIYNGVSDPAALTGLMPAPGYGHVLLTSRDPIAEVPRALAIGPLTRDHASEMLLGLVPEILPEDGAAIGSVLGGVPLALQLAAGWLRVTVPRMRGDGANYATATANAVRELVGLLMAAEATASDPVAVMTGLLLELLARAERGAAARLLLETCAFLAPIGMSRRLLQSPEMLAQLGKVDEDTADPVVLQSVLRTLVTHGFCTRHAPGEPLRVHPRVLELLRGQLTGDEQATSARAVSAMLAASAPVDVDDDLLGHSEIYSELLQHVIPSGAMEVPDASVRTWLVNQVRFLWQLETVSSWQMAAALGERLAARWTAMVGDDDRLRLRLQTQLANVYRSQCRFNLAFETDHEVLVRQSRILGVSHPRTLMTARSYGADLRLIGEFEEALLTDRHTWETFARDYGDDHLLTIIASSNLALSQLMFGDPDQALDRQRQDIARARRIRSEQPWREPWVQFHVGTLLREIGQYKESAAQLGQAKRMFRDLVDQGKLAPTMWAVLRTTAGLAITERRLRNPDPDVTRGILAECENTYGQRYPDTLALRLSLAGDLHETHHPEAAVEQAEAARAGYIWVFGPEHPFTRICEIDLSIYALTAGQQGKADEMSAAALAAFTSQLAPGHLWLLAAELARANVLVAAGQLTEALALEEGALSAYRERLGQYNELTSIAAINASDTRLLLNNPANMPDSVQEQKRRRAVELDTPPY